MKISIITVCYNSVATLATAMESVLDQTYPNIEYIVVDGGSTDGTVELLRRYAEESSKVLKFEPASLEATPRQGSSKVLKCEKEKSQQVDKLNQNNFSTLALSNFRTEFSWLSEPDQGMYDAINKGIRLATGDVIGILNADDFLEDDGVIERIAEVFLQAKIDVVYGDVRFVREAKSENPFFAKTASWVKDGVPAQSANTPAAQLVLHPELPEKNVGPGDVTVESRSLYPVLPPAVSSGLRRQTDTDFNSDLCEKKLICPKSSNKLEDLRDAKTLRYYSAKRWKPWMLQWGYMPPHPGVYIRRELFERLGYYKLGYHIAADYELLIRYLRKSRLNRSYLASCIVGMRPGGKSTKNWRSNLVLNQEIVRGNRENGYFCFLPMLLPKYFFKVWEFVMPWVKRF